MAYLLIAIGGALGSVARYKMNDLVQNWTHARFPLGTLLVNVVGCVLIGVLWRAFMGNPNEQHWRAATIIGFCGGFTTFSTFSMDAIGLIQGGEWLKASVYVVGSVAAGLLGTAIALGRTAPR
jgi:CrcB protein